MTIREDMIGIMQEFERISDLSELNYSFIQKADKLILVINVSRPSDRHFDILERIIDDRSDKFVDRPIVTLKGSARDNIIDGPESKLLLKVLSEMQNVNRYSFTDDFFDRYTKSIIGAEQQIIANANHVVLGRRGAEKSMLLLYAWYMRQKTNSPCAWIDMQVYSGRDDVDIVTDVFETLIGEVSDQIRDAQTEGSIRRSLEENRNDIKKIRKSLPKIRRYMEYFAKNNIELFIFIDDLHVISESIQPVLLDSLYAISRGNKIFLKISAIETSTRTYDQESRKGLEVPHDALNLKLDYNLTAPDKTSEQIEAILDAHARFAGLPSIRRLCSSANVLPRLTWVSAGVPRDAMNLFSQAMQKGSAEGRKRVTVSNVNRSASETLTIKLSEFETDATGRRVILNNTLESAIKFCIRDQRKNAFLVEISSDNELYKNILSLIELRLMHIISEGITIGEVGRKYIGVILDYGFYTGIRAAQSVDLFNQQTMRVPYKELRQLPVFKG